MGKKPSPRIVKKREDAARQRHAAFLAERLLTAAVVREGGQIRLDAVFVDSLDTGQLRLKMVHHPDTGQKEYVLMMEEAATPADPKLPMP